jgi:lipopolysaccharide assembly outer membrane protein LptD (OstA)
MMRRSLLYISVLAVALFTTIGLADRSAVVLKRAKSLRSFEESGVQRKELEGDVWITKDSLSVFCQKATYYPDSGALVLQRNVEFQQPHRILYADEVLYDEITEKVLANGHVRIYQDSLKATSRQAVYQERFKSVFLYDDVRIMDDSRNVELRGQAGFFDHEKQYARVTGSPVLTQRDSSYAVVTQIFGDTVEYFGDTKRASASGNVIVKRDSLLANGNYLQFHQDSSYAELIGEPRAIQQLDEISGDTLRLYFKDEQLEHVEVLGHAVATSPADSSRPEPRNRMEGKRLSLWIENNALSRVVVTGNAIATYYIRENNEPKGRNVTSGDVLYVYFANSKISHIEVKGGTRGVYSPEQIVRREADTSPNRNP